MDSTQWFSLKGKTALITGGSRGLGKAIASAFAGAGASLCLAGRNLEAAETTARELSEKTGSRAAALKVDVTSSAEVNAMVDAAISQFGQIDILVNNAGVNIRGDCIDYTDEDWAAVISCNLTGVFYCCRAIGRHMIGRKQGRVINLASMMGQISLPGRVAYSSSKAAVVGLTRTLALEWAPHSITVNAICPGPFATEMNVPLLSDPQVNASFTSKIPLGRWGNVDEVGALALYLASDAAAFTTGAAHFVDGGWTAQ